MCIGKDFERKYMNGHVFSEPMYMIKVGSELTGCTYHINHVSPHFKCTIMLKTVLVISETPYFDLHLSISMLSCRLKPTANGMISMLTIIFVKTTVLAN